MTVIVPLENDGDGDDDDDDNDNNDDYDDDDFDDDDFDDGDFDDGDNDDDDNDDDDLMMMTILVVCGVHKRLASAQDMTCRHPRPKPSFTSQH